MREMAFLTSPLSKCVFGLALSCFSREGCTYHLMNQPGLPPPPLEGGPRTPSQHHSPSGQPGGCQTQGRWLPVQQRQSPCTLVVPRGIEMSLKVMI